MSTQLQKNLSIQKEELEVAEEKNLMGIVLIVQNMGTGVVTVLA